MSDIQQLENWLQPLIQGLDNAGRRKVLRKLIITLRQQNQSRIKNQENVDGSRYEPRKKNLRGKKGRIKRAPMFTKLRKAKYLRVRATSESAEIVITGSAGKIAAVHHHGKRARYRKSSTHTTEYAERQILGFNDASEKIIAQVIFDYIETL